MAVENKKAVKNKPCCGETKWVNPRMSNVSMLTATHWRCMFCGRDNLLIAERCRCGKSMVKGQ